MLKWTSTLSTGVALLDEHHQAIFEWLGELESAAIEKRTLYAVYVLSRLKQYIREHFAAEEALMKSAGYPRLEEHVAEHAMFRVKFKELELKSVRHDVSVDTVEFLTAWVAGHIAKSDMAYASYLVNAASAQAGAGGAHNAAKPVS